MKVDFTKLSVEVNFEGERKNFNIAKPLANFMKYQCSFVLDIGWEELAKEIYFSDGDIEIPSHYVQHLANAVRECNMYSCIKRELINKLNS